MLPERLKEQPRVDELTMPAMGEQASPAHCDYLDKEHRGIRREGEMKGGKVWRGREGEREEEREEVGRERGRREGGSPGSMGVAVGTAF